MHTADRHGTRRLLLLFSSILVVGTTASFALWWREKAHPVPGTPPILILAAGLLTTATLSYFTWRTFRILRTAAHTSQKRAQHLEDRDRIFNQAQRLAGLGICYSDHSSGLLVHSEEYIRIFGLHPDYSRASNTRHLLDQVLPEDRERVASSLDSFAKGRPTKPFIFRIHTPDRGERTLLSEQGALPPTADQPSLVISVIHDITERVAIDQALAESHTQLDQIMRVLPGAVFQLKCAASEGIATTFISEGSSTLFGQPASELLGPVDKLLHLFPPDQAARLEASLHQAPDTLTPWQLDLWFTPPGGGRRWTRLNVIPERQKKARLTLWSGVATDITVAKEAEQRLLFTQYALDHVRDAVAFVTPHGDRVYANNETSQLTGYSREELLSSKIWSTFTSFTPERYVQLWNLVRQQGTYIFESTIVSKTGEERPVEVRASFINFHDREIVFAIARDITRRKAAEQALRSSETHLHLTQHALDNAQDLVSIMDRDGTRIYFNDTFRTFTGHSREDLLNTKVWTNVPSLDPEKFQQLWDRIRLAGSLRFEIEILAKDGTKKPVEVSASFITYDGRQAVCTISRDLAPRKTAEREKALLEQQLRETQKLESLGVLAGGIAHDFNNLLTGILGNANLARDRLPPSHELHDSLQQIERSSLRAAELCQQMLAYAGKGRFIVAPLNLNTLITDSQKLLRLSVGHRALLDLQLAPHLSEVLADSSQMHQILMNLVINAAEAMARPDGHITVSTQMLHANAASLQAARFPTELPPGECICLEVSDNGPGMDPTTLDRIFEPFFTTKFTGRGLGLAAVSGIVRSHHGALHVHSTPGRGTTFRLLLPPHISKTPTRAPFRPPAPTLTLRSGHILVIDDEETVRTVSKQALQRIGYTVTLTEDGPSALTFLKTTATPPHLILLDFTMPKMDGAETLRQIRQLHPTIPVIMMSGFSEAETRARIGEQTLSGFIPKPFDLETLRTLAATHCP